ncbi:MAG: hypothetical protein M3N07_08720, partial [Pseudomonadota bacterium]|nr:hypothetical protein [Pseudomonadota bacterium]
MPLLAQEERPPAEEPQAPPAEEPLPEKTTPADEEEFDPDALDDGEDSIVVTDQRLRGSVIGDIPPEVQLDPRDIRAIGAGSVAE